MKPDAIWTHENRSTILRARIYAFTVDLALVALLSKGLMKGYTEFLHSLFYLLPVHDQLFIARSMNSIYFSVLTVVFWSYFVLSYYLAEGRTPGKMLFGLKVQCTKSKETNHLTLFQSLSRTFGYFICYGLGSFFFVLPFLNNKRNGLPDWFSKTMVVHEDKWSDLLQASWQVENARADEEIKKLPAANQLELFSPQEESDSNKAA